MLISENLNNSLDLLVQKCFEGNRILDRQMSQLEVKFVMNKTASILHPKLAHQFPLLADEISSYQGSRNAMTKYLETFTDSTDYNNPNEVFVKFLDYMKELEQSVIEVMEIAIDEKDIMTHAFLQSFLLELKPFTNQALLLVDKINAYGNSSLSWMLFDSNIKSFIVVGGA